MRGGRHAHKRPHALSSMAGQDQVKSLPASLMLHEAADARSTTGRYLSGLNIPGITVEENLQSGRSSQRICRSRNGRGVRGLDPRERLADEVHRTFARKPQPRLGILRIASVLPETANRSQNGAPHENGGGRHGDPPIHSSREVVVNDPARSARSRRGLRGANDVREHCHRSREMPSSFKRRLDKGRCPLIVGVQKCHPLRVSHTKSRVPGGSRTSVRCAYQSNSRIAHSRHPLSARVGGSVIDYRHGQIAVTLLQDGLQASLNVAFPVMERNHDADRPCVHLWNAPRHATAIIARRPIPAATRSTNPRTR